MSTYVKQFVFHSRERFRHPVWFAQGRKETSLFFPQFQLVSNIFQCGLFCIYHEQVFCIREIICNSIFRKKKKKKNRREDRIRPTLLFSWLFCLCFYPLFLSSGRYSHFYNIVILALEDYHRKKLLMLIYLFMLIKCNDSKRE